MVGMDKNIIQIKNASMVFDENFRVLNDININVSKGEIVTIFGPNGSGKTVLLWLIAGFIKPSKGKIFYDGKIVTSPDPSRLMIFQNYSLFSWRNALGNVEAAMENQNVSKKEVKASAKEALKLVGLEKFASWPVFKLSGGMQQRICLARALVAKSKVWLLDEPFSALDSFNREKMRQLIINLQKETQATIIAVTHNAGEAIKFSDKVIMLTKSPGRVIKIFDTSKIGDAYSKRFIKVKTDMLKILNREQLKSRSFVQHNSISDSLIGKELE